MAENVSIYDLLAHVRGGVNLTMRDPGRTGESFQYKAHADADMKIPLLKSPGYFHVICNQQAELLLGILQFLADLAIEGSIEIKLEPRAVMLSGNIIAYGPAAYWRMQEKISRATEIASTIATLATDVDGWFKVNVTCEIRP